MTLPIIAPADAKRLLAHGARLIDIRADDEFAREAPEGAASVPLDRLHELAPTRAEETLIFTCRSGNRTAVNAHRLAAAAPCNAFVLEGGLEGWARAGLPVRKDASQPLELMRQVQIAAGLLILLGVVFAVSVHPAFVVLSAFVGAGLTFAGLTGWCGMARLLAVMPWNRRVAGAAA